MNMYSLRKIVSFLINFLLDNDRKSIPKIVSEIQYLKRKHPNKSSQYYFTSLVYKKNAGDINNYIPAEDYLNINLNYYRGNGIHPILQNKNRFVDFMLEMGLPVPKRIGSIKENKLKDLTSGLVITNKQHIYSKINKWGGEFGCVFIKQVDGEGGGGVFKIDNTIRDIRIDKNLEYIIEAGLVQHAEIYKINPYCINTLRVITVRDKQNNIHIPDCFFRMGTGTSYVDNASSGGIFTHYDIYNNKMDKVAYSLPISGGKSYYKHPTTGFIFENAELPFSKEIIDLVSKAARCFPEQELIGWDIAYTEGGVVFIEANDNPHITMMQISAKGLLFNEVYRAVFQQYLIS